MVSKLFTWTERKLVELSEMKQRRDLQVCDELLFAQIGILLQSIELSYIIPSVS